MSKILITLLCLVALPTLAGVRVEIDKPNKTDRTCQIAADEFRKFYKELTGRDAAGETRVLLRIDPKLSADGYDAFSLKSDAQGAVLTGGDRKAKLRIAYRDYHKWMLGTPLKEMAPTRARTPENFRRAMLGLAEGAEIVCPHAPDADEGIHFDVADEFFN